MNTKIRCLLLDDELPGLALLKMLCEQIDGLEIVKAFNSPQALLDEWESLDFDLLISDIEMPGMNGLQVADALQGKAVVFVTAYKNFAVDAFDRDAVDYVIKPVKPERLQQAIHKAVSRIVTGLAEPKKIQLNTDRGKALISTGKIFCIMTSDIDSRDKVLMLDDRSRITAKNCPFERLMELLPSQSFCRINKKTILAVKHVQYYNHEEIITDMLQPDGRHYTFPLSEIYRPEFSKLVKA